MPEVLPTTQKLSYVENIYIPVLQLMKTEAQTSTRSWLVGLGRHPTFL